MNDPNVIAYYSSENRTITYYWMEFNGQCYGYDSVNVYFGSIQQAIHLVDEADSLNCGRLTDLLAAQQPAYGNGYWYDELSLTQFYPNNFSNNPDSTIISAASYGWHYFHWVTVNGDCRDTTDAVPIKFIRQPNAYAGSHYYPGLFGPNSQIKTDTVCGLRYKLSAVPSYGIGQWFTLDPVNTWFTSEGKDASGLAIPSPLATDSANILFYTVFNPPYYREFVWMEDNESCVDKDTLRLYFAPRPSGNFSATTPDCRYFNSLIVANTWPLPNNINYGITYFGWDVGNGIVVDTNGMFQQDSILVHWNTGTTHTVSLITENKWGCRSVINISQVNEPPLFNPLHAINPATCGNPNGELILSTSGNTYQFHWLDSAIANPYDTAQTGLIPGYNYQIVVTGQSLSPDATPGTLCNDTIAIAMTNAGNITALFDTTFTQMLPVPFDQQLINLTSNGRRFSWRIFDQNGNLVGTSSAENPTWTFEEPGCYRLVLVAESKVDTSWFGIERFGCKDTFEYKWLCFDATPLLEIPNVFTPNSDGMNDLFLVHAKSIVEFKGMIFSRWGKKIFEWDEITKGWDGKIGGADASPGVYYYIITAKGKDDTEFEYKGFFYLMREK
jgi:gliding motility-associated-like protein